MRLVLPSPHQFLFSLAVPQTLALITHFFWELELLGSSPFPTCQWLLLPVSRFTARFPGLIPWARSAPGWRVTSTYPGADLRAPLCQIKQPTAHC